MSACSRSMRVLSLGWVLRNSIEPPFCDCMRRQRSIALRGS
jgi:hypothetical protein